MPGLFGIYNKKQLNDANLPGLVSLMARKMKYWDGQKEEIFLDSNQKCAIGRLGLADSVTFQQPVFDTTNRYRFFLDGYISDYYQPHSIRQHTFDRGEAGIQELIGLFAEHGPGIVQYLNGVYFIALYDNVEQRLYLMNDRYGLHYHYIAETNDYFIFSGELKSITATGLVDMSIDERAVCDMLNFEFITGDRTLLKSVKLFPYGSYAVVDASDVRVERYWDYPYRDPPPHKTLADNIAECDCLFEKAIARQIDGENRVGIPLSGGLDSRTIAAYARPQLQSLKLFHVGSKATYLETRLARRVCDVLGGEWNFLDFPQLYTPDNIRAGAYLSDGQVSTNQFWELGMAKAANHDHDLQVLLDGYCLDAQLGKSFLLDDINHDSPTEYKIGRLVDIFARFQEDHLSNWFADPNILSPFYANNLIRLCSENVIESVGNHLDLSVPNLSQYYTFTARARRYTVGALNTNRVFIEYRFPFMDYDLFDFCLSVPVRFRKNSAIHRGVLTRRFPELSKIPWAKTELPLNKVSSLRTSFKQHVAKYKASVNILSRGRFELGHQDWKTDRRFRKDDDFREFYLDLLHDDRMLSRGIVTKEGVERLVRSIDTGYNQFGVVQSLATIEFFYRTIID